MNKVRHLILFVMMVLLGVFVLGCTSEKNMALPNSLPEFVLESDFDIIDWNRKVKEFDGMMGNERIAGIIGAVVPSLEQQNWLWHLWGVAEPEMKELTVVGYHKETQTVHPILLNDSDNWSIAIGSQNNGADAQIPTTIKIPESGEWAILIYVDEELFDVLVYEI